MGRRIEDHPDGTRTCTSCGGRFPLATSFDIDKGGTLGRRAHCKPCRSERMKAWYQANRERQAARAQARRDADPDRHRKQDLERYYRSKPKRLALVEAHGHKRRALKAQSSAVDGITKTALRKIHGDECCYCGVTMDFGPSKGRGFVPDRATIEHIVALTRGGAHDWDNVTLCCRRCNQRKGARTAEQYRTILAHEAGQLFAHG